MSVIAAAALAAGLLTPEEAQEATKEAEDFSNKFSSRVKELFPDLTEDEQNRTLSLSSRAAQKIGLLLLVDRVPAEPRVHRLIGELFLESSARAGKLAEKLTQRAVPVA